MRVNILSKLNSTLIIHLFLITFIMLMSLFINPNVYNFRINQEFILRIFILIFVCFWIIRLLLDNQLFWVKNPCSLFILIFSLYCTFSLIISGKAAVGRSDYLNYLSYFFLFLFIIHFIRQKNTFNQVAKTLFFTAFIISLYSLFQYYGWGILGHYSVNLTSTIGQKNWVSNYLGMIFPLSFAYFLLEENKKNKILYLFFLTIAYASLIICQSRGIWISIGLTMPIAFMMVIRFQLTAIFQKNLRWIFILMGIYLLITMVYSTENVLNKSPITATERALSALEVIEDPAGNARFHIWRVTLKMFEDNPIFGLGIGTFKYDYQQYQSRYLKENPDYIRFSGKAAEAHNEYLQLAAETGIIGLVLFMAFIFSFYSLFYLYLKNTSRMENRLIVFGMATGITIFLAHCLFTFPFHVPVLGSIFFILLGLTVSFVHETEERGDLKGFFKTIVVSLNIRPLLRYTGIAMIVFLGLLALVDLAITPYRAELNYHKGTKLFAEKDNANALIYYHKAAEMAPENGRILHALGSVYYQLGMQEEARQILLKTKEIYYDKNTYRNMGLSYLQTREYQRAEAEFRQAITIDPIYYQAYHDLASVYIYQNNYEKAIQIWEEAISLGLVFPEKHIFYYYIGIAYERLNEPELADLYFQHAIDIAPEDSSVREDIERRNLNLPCEGDERNLSPT